MIELTAVGFAYGTAPVLEAIDFRVSPGELVAVVGPNGAGKSTLLRLCAGLLEPTSGTIAVLGSSPTDVSRAQLARQLAFVPQSYRLAFPFSVRDVVLMGRYPHGRRGLFGFESATDHEAADRAIERCDLTDLADRRFDSLSGGEHRRVLLAQAFCQQAELILLDEPTANLDPAHALSVWDALLERKRSEGERSAAVVVTHDLNLAIRYSDRIVLVHDHAIAADGSPREVLSSDAASDAFGVAMHIGELPGTDRPFAVPT